MYGAGRLATVRARARHRVPAATSGSEYDPGDKWQHDFQPSVGRQHGGCQGFSLMAPSGEDFARGPVVLRIRQRVRQRAAQSAPRPRSERLVAGVPAAQRGKTGIGNRQKLYIGRGVGIWQAIDLSRKTHG